MKIVNRKESNDDNTFKYSEVACPICMDEMNIEIRSVTAPCMHEFCIHCIGKWLTESSSQRCPLCKQIVKKIMYSIKNKKTYSIIGFPNDFLSAWTIRNIMKNVFEDYYNVLVRIYGSIQKLYAKEHNLFHSEILAYLVWFGNVQMRVKSRETGDEAPVELLLNEEYCDEIIKSLIKERLCMFFKVIAADRIIKKIYDNNTEKLVTVNDILTCLTKYIEPVKIEILRKEIQCYTLMKRTGASDKYLEYFISLPYDNTELVIFTDCRIVDENVLAGITTKLLGFFNTNFDDDRRLVAHVNIIHSLCYTYDDLSSYSQLLNLLADATQFILHNNGFYKKMRLGNFNKIQSTLISSNAYNLVKHCFNPDDFQNIEQIRAQFEKQYIYIEPIVIEDSCTSSCVSSEDVEINGTYMELSDSDDDALEVVSIHVPVIDLVDDDEDLEPSNKRNRLSSMSELSESGVTDASNNPCPSEIAITSTSPQEEQCDDNAGESLPVIATIDSNALEFNFIYQPLSTADFYQYLLSENTKNQ